MPNSPSTAHSDLDRAVERPLSGEGASAAVFALERLRRVGKLEAVSFLVLLGIAMPLKYLAHWPLAVKVVGWAHGVLFVWFVISLWRAKRDARLSFGQALAVLVAALLPFGPFVIDRRLAREAASRAPS
jgi:integral membrane protein